MAHHTSHLHAQIVCVVVMQLGIERCSLHAGAVETALITPVLVAENDAVGVEAHHDQQDVCPNRLGRKRLVTIHQPRQNHQNDAVAQAGRGTKRKRMDIRKTIPNIRLYSPRQIKHALCQHKANFHKEARRWQERANHHRRGCHQGQLCQPSVDVEEDCGFELRENDIGVVSTHFVQKKYANSKPPMTNA